MNVIVGDNGAGKSTILESLQVVARGRSPRGPAHAIVRHQHPSWRAEAGLVTKNANDEDRVRVDWQGRQTATYWNDKPVTALELASRVPVLRIEPDGHRLLEDGPTLRRQLVDWGVFHMEHQFIGHWRQARYCLQQRNAALRSGLPKPEVSVWNRELETAATKIDQARQRYVRALQTEIDGLSEHQEAAPIGIELHPGWSGEEGLSMSLDRVYDRDRKHGHTSVGPHRAELRILLDGRLARNWISRGQQKTLIARVVLAQVAVFFKQKSWYPVLLIDDFASELSKSAQNWLLGHLAKTDAQIFLTCLDPIHDSFLPSAHRMFHVEHGQVT